MSDVDTDSLRTLIGICVGGAPGAPAAIGELAARRRTLAAALLAGGSDPRALAPYTHAADGLGASGLPYEMHPDHTALADRIGALLAQSAPPANAVLAAMALAPAHHFPPPVSLASLPEDLRLPYARYLMASPVMFEGYGEADRFALHRLRAIARLHAAVFQERLAEAGNIADIATSASNVMLYFNNANLKAYFRARAELLEWRLQGQQLQLRYLPPLSASPRLRIGILHRGLEPNTETYYLLAHLVGRDPATEIILYLESALPGPLVAEFTRRVDRVIPLPSHLPAAAAQIRADDLDVLLITRNVTALEYTAVKLAAHRLARVQVIGAASPVTSGLSSADFFMSGEMNDPATDAQDHYEECLVKLPELTACFAFTYDRQPRSLSFSRPALGIAADDVVFFSAANCFKIIPEVFRTWTRILAAAPGSRLVLMPYNPNWFDSYATALFRRRIARQLAEQGVAPERVTILDAVPARADLHAAMAIADVYLDSFPFAGACSLVDPLQAGLPVVAMDGGTYRSAVAESILKASGLEYMVCRDAESYIARACGLAADAEARRRERDEVSGIDPAFLPCTWTAPFAQAFADFARAAAAAWAARADAVRMMDPDDLKDRIRELAHTLRQQRNAGYLQLTDVALITQCIHPYLQTLKTEGAPAGRIVDVGACVGEASMPFLRGGWRVDLFEPDPECHQPLAAVCAAFPNAKHFAVAVTGAPAGPVTFHKRGRGLSGLGASPYAAQENDLTVPSTTLPEVYRTLKLQADFLKIDAEGHDLEILAGADIPMLAPKVVMIEFGTAFAGHSPAAIQEAISRMARDGYDVVAFSNRQLEGFGVSNWACELDTLTFGEIGTLGDGGAAGNLVFFQAGDTTLLASLFLLLDSFRPAQERRWGLPAAD